MQSQRTYKETSEQIKNLFDGPISFEQLDEIMRLAIKAAPVTVYDYADFYLREYYGKLTETDQKIIKKFVNSMNRVVNNWDGYQPGGDLLEKAANGTSGRTLDEIAADNMTDEDA